LSTGSDDDRTGPRPWHATAAADVLRLLASDRRRGLTAEEAARRLAETGPNALATAPAVPVWARLAMQFRDLVVWILIVAALISGLLGEWADTVAILAIVTVNGLIGFVQEERAHAALAALEQLSAPMARVVRDGHLLPLPARALVPGDRVELEAGDAVPADARLLDAHALVVQEAALTGESVPVEKEAEAVLPGHAALGDRRTMLHAGTVVTGGRASAVVVGTGMATELGRIASLLGRGRRETTPLQRRLAELGRILIVVCLGIVVVIFAIEVSRGGPLWEVLLLSSSLAVAAVPEGLPAVVTLVLAGGLRRMVGRHALVRRLPSVETLGSVTVVCSDKTGTLTRNEMTVREIVAGSDAFRVTGAGYAPDGGFIARAAAPDQSAGEPPPAIMPILEVAAWCSTATVEPSADHGEGWRVLGDPTEGALVVAAMKGGVTREDGPADSRGGEIVFEIPFDSQRKRMSVAVRNENGRTRLLTKGAPEVLLALCDRRLENDLAVPLAPEDRERIAREAASMAGRALRVLAFAFRDLESDAADETQERNLVFLGLVGMIDPPRDEARRAIETCRRAGIRPVMITGDHPATARAIAVELGLAMEADEVLTGRGIDALDDVGLRDRVRAIAVYARVSAEHKLRVVQAWQAAGEVVAMTGDGVNDAPAVKAADIGIAMGITGTDVTKEASDMVLTDDNFASIVAAVEEGRGIYDNIQKCIHYLLSCNAGEVMLVFLAALVGWPVPLAAIQILWINLVTDGLPALALGMELPEPDIMGRPPRPPREPVITLGRGIEILWHGVLIAAVCGLAFRLTWGGDEARLPLARTATFCVAAFSQLLFSLACRSDRATFFGLGWRHAAGGGAAVGAASGLPLLAAIAVSACLQFMVILLPAARGVFEVEALPDGRTTALVFGLSLVPVSLVEMAKWIRR